MPLILDPQLKAAIVAIRTDPDMLPAEKAELIRALLEQRRTRNENLVVES